MIHVIGAITVHMWDDRALLVVDQDARSWPDSRAYDSFVDASWAAALTWLDGQGLDVLDHKRLLKDDVYDVYAAVRFP